jgi:hypothetical protein
MLVSVGGGGRAPLDVLKILVDLDRKTPNTPFPAKLWLGLK